MTPNLDELGKEGLIIVLCLAAVSVTLIAICLGKLIF